MVERPAALGSSRVADRFEWPLISWGLALSLVWEFAHSALYVDHGRGVRHVLWTRLHCSFGDVLILLSAFWATAAVYRSWRWPESHDSAAATLFVGLGFGYTVWSEWFNTTVRQAWNYDPAMPQILGLGVSPLLQWLVVPSLLIFIMQSWARRATTRGGQT